MGAKKKTAWRYPTPATRVRRSYCHRCKQEILSTLYNALPLRLDPQSLSLVGEVSALALGHTTWLVAGENYLSRRTTWAIQTSPHGIGGRVVRSHQCGISPAPSHIHIPEIEPGGNPPF